MSLNGEHEHFHTRRVSHLVSWIDLIRASTVRGDTDLESSCKWPTWRHFIDAETFNRILFYFVRDDILRHKKKKTGIGEQSCILYRILKGVGRDTCLVSSLVVVIQAFIQTRTAKRTPAPLLSPPAALLYFSLDTVVANLWKCRLRFFVFVFFSSLFFFLLV